MYHRKNGLLIVLLRGSQREMQTHVLADCSPSFTKQSSLRPTQPQLSFWLQSEGDYAWKHLPCPCVPPFLPYPGLTLTFPLIYSPFLIFSSLCEESFSLRFQCFEDETFPVLTSSYSTFSGPTHRTGGISVLRTSLLRKR